MDTIVSRLKDYLEYKDISVSIAEKEVGVSNASLSKPFKNGTSIKTDTLEKFLKVYNDINSEWLFGGVMPMIKKTIDADANPVAVSNGIPFVSVTAIGGFGSTNFAIQQEDVKEYYVIPKFKHKKIDFMIEVEGSSMYPKYSSGDVVACTIIKESNFIQWNKTHVIITREQGIIIKRLKKSDVEDNLIMISDNKSYDQFEVNKNDILGIALVVGVIRLE